LRKGDCGITKGKSKDVKVKLNKITFQYVGWNHYVHRRAD
jgi:hypothetical protein